MTPEPLQFDAALEVLAWGRNTYVVVKVPDELVVRARAASTRRVEGTIDDVAVNVGLNAADVLPETFLYVGPGLRRRLGAGAGDVVTCRLAPADPDHVPLADDVLEALETSGRLDAFERLGAPQRRQLLVPVEGAVKPETRARRLAALVASLPPD